jgi:hypothetical protein
VRTPSLRVKQLNTVDRNKHFGARNSWLVEGLNSWLKSSEERWMFPMNRNQMQSTTPSSVSSSSSSKPISQQRSSL